MLTGAGGSDSKEERKKREGSGKFIETMEGGGKKVYEKAASHNRQPDSEQCQGKPSLPAPSSSPPILLRPSESRATDWQALTANGGGGRGGGGGGGLGRLRPRRVGHHSFCPWAKYCSLGSVVKTVW